jgi:hypothetical protein
MSLDTIPTLTVTEANVLRRAFPIVDEAQEMICPTCQHAFPAEFIVSCAATCQALEPATGDI